MLKVLLHIGENTGRKSTNVTTMVLEQGRRPSFNCPSRPSSILQMPYEVIMLLK